MDIVVNKKTAEARVSDHRERHVEEYKAQYAGWQEAMQKFSQDLKIWSEGPATADRPKEPVRPTNYLKQYDDLLDKLGYHDLDTITLNDHEFDRVMNDSFGWTAKWFENNTLYGINTPEYRKAPIYMLGDASGSLNSYKRGGQEYPSDHIEV